MKLKFLFWEFDFFRKFWKCLKFSKKNKNFHETIPSSKASTGMNSKDIRISKICKRCKIWWKRWCLKKFWRAADLISLWKIKNHWFFEFFTYMIEYSTCARAKLSLKHHLFHQIVHLLHISEILISFELIPVDDFEHGIFSWKFRFFLKISKIFKIFEKKSNFQKKFNFKLL